jgi:hypothetical protein
MTAAPFAGLLFFVMAFGLFAAAVITTCHAEFPTWTFTECLQPVAERINQ